MKWLKKVMNLSDIKFYNFGKSVLYVMDRNMKWGRITSDLADSLRELDGRTFEEIYSEILVKGIIGKGELLTILKNISDTNIKENLYNYKNKTAFFIVTKGCNLFCKTCYVSSGKNNQEKEMTPDKMEIAFQKLNRAGYKSIVLSGGEPFLRKDIKEIIELASEYFRSITVNTNGTLLTYETISFLKDKNVSVMISLEGVEAGINDAIRGYGSFDKIMRAIQCFKEVGHENISVSMTVTHINHQSTVQLYKMCSELNIPVHFGIFIETGRGLCNSDLLKISTKELVESFVSILEKEAENREPAKYLPSFITRCRTHCGAIHSILNIMPDGQVYPCPNLIDLRYKMGNILDNEIEYIVQNSHLTKEITDRVVTKMNDCEDCAVKFICGGGCMANAYFENQDIYSRDPLCSFYKKIYTSYIKEWDVARTDIENVREVIKNCREDL